MMDGTGRDDQPVQADEKPKQEMTTCTGPLDVKREVTDHSFIIAFGVLMLIWLIVGFYAFSAGDPELLFYLRRYSLHVELVYMARFFHKNINEARYVVIGFLIWSAFLLGIMAVMFRWTTKIFIWITIALSAGLVFLFLLLLSYGMHEMIFESIIVIIILFCIIIGYALLIYSLISTGVKVACKVIKESCKVMFFFPSTLVLAMIQFSLQVLVAIFAGAVYMYLTSIREPIFIEAEEHSGNVTEDYGSEENQTDLSEHWFYEDEYFYRNFTVPHYVHLFHLINYTGFFWSTWFLMGIGRMVLTAAFATWYHTKDKKTIPQNLLPQCFMMIMRHHAGTLAYASSPITIFPMCYVVWKYGSDKLKEMYKRPVLIFSWLTIALKFSFDAMTISAIHGYTFYKSGKESYIMFMKHPVSYLTMSTVTEHVVFLGTILHPVLAFFSVLGFIQIFEVSMSGAACATATMVVTYIATFMSTTFFMVFRSAANTIRYCYHEDAKLNHESEMNLYDVQVDDLSIHDVYQDP